MQCGDDANFNESGQLYLCHTVLPAMQIADDDIVVMVNINVTEHCAACLLPPHYVGRQSEPLFT